MLTFDEDFVVVGEVATGREALEKFGQLLPEIVIMDLFLPDISGIRVIAGLCSLYDHVSIIAIATFSDTYWRAAMMAGPKNLIEYTNFDAPPVHFPDGTILYWTSDLAGIKKIAAKTREAISRDREIQP
jgi:CheY-like chemotaxis protein